MYGCRIQVQSTFTLGDRIQVQSTLAHSYTQPQAESTTTETSGTAYDHTDGKNSASTVYVHTYGQNLGTTFTSADIIQVLSTFPLTNNSVTVYVHTYGQNSGTVYVRT
jgi:hypothetical protein